jgi:hypothetical protein
VRARAGWLAAAWVVVAGAVWCGFYDILISRGTKDYFILEAAARAGEGPAPSLAAIMAETRDAAFVTSTWFGALVLVAGWATIWLARRRAS